MSLAQDNSCMATPSPDALPIVTATACAILSVIASLANGAAIYIFIKHWKNKLNYPFYFHIANLAVADFMVGIVTNPLGVAVHIFESQRRPFSEFKNYVIILHVSIFINSSASVLCVLAMAVDRFVAVRFSLIHRRFLTARIKWPIAALIWLISIALSLIYFVVGFNKMAFVFANATAFSTIMVMAVSYFVMFRFFKKRISNEFNNNAHLQQRNNQCHSKELKAKTQKTLNILLTMLASFCITYIPACLAIYYINFCQPCNCVAHHWLRDLQSLFSLTSSCINPICYIWRLREFRNFFRRSTLHQNNKAVAANAGRCNRLDYRRRNIDFSQVTPAPSQSSGNQSSSTPLSSVDITCSSSFSKSDSTWSINKLHKLGQNSPSGKYLSTKSQNAMYAAADKNGTANFVCRSCFTNQGFIIDSSNDDVTTLPASVKFLVADTVIEDTRL